MNKIEQSPVADTAEGNGTSEADPQSTDSRNLPVVYDPAKTGESEGRFTRWLYRLFGRNKPSSSVRDDISQALSTHPAISGEFTPEEAAMLNNILALQEVRVEDLMVPRAEIEAVDLTTTLGELLSLFERSGHSRMPVYSENLDDPRGMVHIRDVVAFITRKAGEGRKRKDGTRPFNLSRIDLGRELGKLNLTRKVLFVPPSMPAAELMARMQASRIQIALVIDEYGGTEGLVSLEDIVEVIVGDIEDEHDDEEEMIRDLGDGRILCDARAEIEDISEFAGTHIDWGEHDEDADTIGGAIISLLGRVPVKGELIEAFGYELVIRDADPRRIKSIEMAPKKRTASRKTGSPAGSGQAADTPHADERK